MLNNYGKKKARAVEWSQVRPNENSGNEEIQVLFQFTGDDDPDKGKTLTYYGYFTDGTAERTIEALRLCGWDGDDITNVQDLNRNEVQLVVEQEEKQDGSGMRDRIKWVNRLHGVYIGTPMGDTQKAAFKKRMQALVIASKQGGPRKPATVGSAGSGTDFPHGHNAPPPAPRAGGVKL